MSTPNIVSNSITRTIFSTILITVIGCTPGAIVDDLDDASTDAATEDGDGDATGETDAPADLPETGELIWECDDLGRCWVRRPWWGAWAQAIDLAQLQEGLEGDPPTLTPAPPIGDAECWWYSATARTCVIEADGALLVGIPVEDATIVDDSKCAPAGPWTGSFMTAFWCRAVVGGVAVATRPI